MLSVLRELWCSMLVYTFVFFRRAKFGNDANMRREELNHHQLQSFKIVFSKRTKTMFFHIFGILNIFIVCACYFLPRYTFIS